MPVALSHILLAIAALLVVISAVQPLARKLAVSDAVLLALVGILIGAGATFVLRTSYTNALDGAAEVLTHFPIRSQAILLIFLPPLVFHGGLHNDVRRLARDATPVLLMAVVAVIVTTVTIGYALRPLAGLSLTACLLLGAIVATTDPSAVVGVFRMIGADRRLTRLVEGEALLNDAAAIAIFTTLLGQLTQQQVVNVPQTVIALVISLMGGMASGFCMARIVLQAVPLLGGIRAAEISLILALPWLAFLISDEYLHVSGVVAAAAAGLTVGALGPSTFRPQSWDAVVDFWDELAFLCNSLVFVLASMLVPHLLLGITRWDWVMLVALVGAAMAARAAVLFGLMPGLTKLGLAERVPAAFKLTILWGGLRGAITLALALAVTENAAVPEPVKRFVVILATGFALVTLLINGTTLRFVVNWLGLNQLSAVDQALRGQVVAIGLGEVRDRVRGMAEDFSFSATATKRVLDSYDRRAREEADANNFDTAITDRDRIKLALISYASKERSVLLNMFRDRGLSRPIMENLLRSADSMLDGARSDGRLGYIRAARRRLRPGARFRAAQWLHCRFHISAPLMSCMTARYEMLFVMHLVQISLAGYMRRRVQPVLGQRVVDVVDEIVGRREQLLDDAMEAMRLQYPGYAEALETRMLRSMGILLESEVYDELHDESLIGEELHAELTRALEERQDRVSQPLRFNLQAGLGQRIRAIPIFSGLSEAVLYDLALHLTMRFTAPGEVIARMGQQVHSVFFISSGAVRLEGEPERLLGRGDFFGVEEAINGARYGRRIVSARFSHLLELDAEHLRALLTDAPDLASRLEKAQCEAIAAAAQPMASQAVTQA